MPERFRPHYDKAKEMAAAQGTPNDKEVIVGFLLQMLFYEPLRERFARDGQPSVAAEADLVARQDEAVMPAIILGRALGAKSAQEAAELAAGRSLTAEEWEKVQGPWDRNWSRA